MIVAWCDSVLVLLSCLVIVSSGYGLVVSCSRQVLVSTCLGGMVAQCRFDFESRLHPAVASSCSSLMIVCVIASSVC